MRHKCDVQDLQGVVPKVSHPNHRFALHAGALPPSWSRLEALSHIDLSQNSLTGKVPNHIFRGCLTEVVDLNCLPAAVACGRTILQASHLQNHSCRESATSMRKSDKPCLSYFGTERLVHRYTLTTGQVSEGIPSISATLPLEHGSAQAHFRPSGQTCPSCITWMSRTLGWQVVSRPFAPAL